VAARRALVAGVTGLIGTRIAERLHEDGWSVIGLARRAPAVPRAYPVWSVDLTDPRDCRAKLRAAGAVSHVFYAARYDHPEGETESVAVNAAMLENLIDALEPEARALEHVHLVHGTKHYGHMLGPLPVPITEETPRARKFNFYFAHEDYIGSRREGKAWSYSIARPHTFCDASPAEPRNAALLIAVHASLARALGRPLIYPGTAASFRARTQFTYVPMLARASAWMATAPQCRNEAFNIVNGDAPRWSELWPQFAAYFGVECGLPTSVRLQDHLGDQHETWQTLVESHGLERVALEARVLLPYADYLFSPEWDIISSTSKARGAGFSESVDSARMFLDLFDGFRSAGIIP
jgi:nucleoside-diphosphate-sugar epimerase